MATASTKQYALPAHAELRVTVVPPAVKEPAAANAADAVRIKVSAAASAQADDDGATTSAADCFGAELACGASYALHHNGGCRAVAISAGSGGCVVTVDGDAQQLKLVTTSAPTANGVPSPSSSRWLADLHHSLNVRRSDARKAGAEGLGPRVMVVSSSREAGKSTVCRTLCNYAVRSGYHPLLISADSVCPMLGQPGCLSATSVQHPLGLEEGAGFVPHVTHTTGRPLGANPAADAGIFKNVLAALVDSAEQRTMRYERCRTGGVIVDTFADDGSDASAALLLEIAEQCGIDTVVVLGGDRLRHRLRVAATRHIVIDGPTTFDVAAVNAVVTAGGSHLKLLNFPNLDGCPQLLPADRRFAAVARWREYFYGTATSPITPTTLDVALADATLLRLGSSSAALLDGMLPMQDDSGLADTNAAGGAADVVISSAEVGIDDIDVRRHVLALMPWGAGGADDEDREADGGYLEAAKTGAARGFALVVGVTRTHLTLLVPATALPAEAGNVFIVTETTL
jgi:polyribonucleotide 5'-hydroxyl-kinase